MLPDRVSNPGPLTYESGALPIALRGPAQLGRRTMYSQWAPASMGVRALIQWCLLISGGFMPCQESFMVKKP